MTATQIFQLSGLTFFAIGVGMLVNPKFVKNIFQDFNRSTANVFYGGLMSLVIGFFLVSFYSSWSINRYLIITIMGWLALAKGLGLLMFPLSTTRLYKAMRIENYSSLIGFPITAFGLILIYFGYFA
jgi:hypothetical protein